MEIGVIIGVLGLITGFLSGLLGIGGGIIMAPLLLYVPPLLGFPQLSMHTVAGLTIVQGLVACISGGTTHKKSPFFSGTLVAWMGSILFLSSFGGGALSAVASNKLLLLIFSGMAVAASCIILFPNAAEAEYPDINTFSFNRFRAVIVSGVVGFLGGLVGQGGSFILIPLMTAFVKIPTRIAIGSNLAIVFLSSLAAFMGKAVTFQINWLLSLPIVLSVIPGAYLGARLSSKVSVIHLRKILAICIGLAAIRITVSAVSQ